MKVPKISYHISVFISTIVATLYYTVLPFIVGTAAVMCLQLDKFWTAIIMLILYVYMSERKKITSALTLMGFEVDDGDNDEGEG